MARETNWCFRRRHRLGSPPRDAQLHLTGAYSSVTQIGLAQARDPPDCSARM